MPCSDCRTWIPDAARRKILELEQNHGERRSWVWASLGSAPLAHGYRASRQNGDESPNAWRGERRYRRLCTAMPIPDGWRTWRFSTHLPLSRGWMMSRPSDQPYGRCIARGWRESLKCFRTLLLRPSQTATKRHLRQRLRLERAYCSSMAFGSTSLSALEPMLEQKGDRGGCRATTDCSAVSNRYG